VFQVETAGAEHAAGIVEDIAAHGYEVEVVNARTDT
jgi:threonine dehydratase